MRVDLGFLLNARQALLPLPLVDRAPTPPADVLPPFEPRTEKPPRQIVAADGSAASVEMIGLARVFEEAGVRPARITACSASAWWGAMWAGGRSAQEMADSALSWRPEAHLGVQWIGLPRFTVSALRGFTGLAKAEALEALFDRRTWRMSAGAAEFPFHVLAYDLEARRFELLGTETTPDLTLGELARVATALPRKSEAVRIEGRFYADAAAAPGFTEDHLGGGELVGMAPWDFYGLFLDRREWPELMRRRRPASPS